MYFPSTFEEIYIDENLEELKLIEKMMNNPNCPVMLNGLTKIKMDYYFCLSCDPNQKEPICEECSEKCHTINQHTITFRHIYDEIDNQLPITCSCGLRCHKLNVNNNNSAKYESICYFHELTIQSNENIYYKNINNNNDIICIFCELFCLGKDSNLKENFDKNYKLENFDKIKTFKCYCPSLNHNDIKQMMYFMNDFVKRFSLKNNSKIHLFNLLLKCEKSFANIYSGFLDEFNKFEGLLNDKNFKLNAEIVSNGFLYWGYSNLLKNSSLHHYNFYYNDKINNFYKINIIEKILNKKFEGSQIVLNFIIIILKGFKKFTICSLLEPFPKLKIIDITNLNPLQRLIFANNIKKDNHFISNNYKTKFVNLFLNYLEKIIKIHFTIIEEYELMLIVLLILKKFAKYYLFKYDQIIKCISILDDIFFHISNYYKKNISNKKIQTIELKLIQNLTKMLILFSFQINDNIIYKNIIENKILITENTCNFVHFNSVSGKIISKIMINIVNFLRSELENLNEENLFKKNPLKKSKLDMCIKLKSEIFHSFSKKKTKKEIDLTINNIKRHKENLIQILQLNKILLSIYLHQQDCYLIGLKNSLNHDLENMIKLINNELTKDEVGFSDYLDRETINIENKYLDYFNFKCTLIELTESIQKSINIFFSQMDLIDYKIPVLSDDDSLNSNDSNSVEYRNDNELNLSGSDANFKLKRTYLLNMDPKEINIPFYLIAFKSNYLFSLCKIFRVSNNENEISEDLILSILRVLYYITDNHPNNCTIFLSACFLDVFTFVPFLYVEKIMKFIIKSLITIYNHKLPLNNLYNCKLTAFILYSKTINFPNQFINLLQLLLIYNILKKMNNLNQKSLIFNLKKDLEKLWFDCSFFGNYKKYLLVISSKDKYEYEEDEDNENIFNSIINNENISFYVGFQIFVKFLTLINDVYDDNALTNQTKILSTFLNNKEIIQILQKKDLDLKLRIELIRFFRMVYIDLYIDKNRLIDYRKEFCRDIDCSNYEDYQISMDQLKVFTLLERIVKISGTNFNTEIAEDEYNMLLFEIQNFKGIIDSSEQCSLIIFRSYIENGILLPLKVYLNKIFSISINMNGLDFLKIYKFCVHILEMKKHILLSNYYKFDNLYNDFVDNDVNKTASVVNKNKFKVSEIKDLEKDIDNMKSLTFQALDYINVHDIVNRHIMSLIQNPTSKELVSYFQDSDSYFNRKNQNFKEELQKKGLLLNNKIFEINLINLIEIYISQKNIFDKSSTIQCLEETHPLLEVNYRVILLKFLFFLTTETTLFEEDFYTKESNEIILHMLQTETSLTQKAITDLLSDKVFDSNYNQLAYISDICFTNFLSIIFNQYNPTTTEITDDYYIFCNIIKIFKFLCEEHNRFFQQIFLKKLEYNISETKKAPFFNMMLFILDKILILTGWNQTKGKIEENSIDYFYGLFTCIVEFLIEAIQGTENQNFENLIKKIKDINYNIKHNIDNNTLNLMLKNSLKETINNKSLYKNTYLKMSLNQINSIKESSGKQNLLLLSKKSKFENYEIESDNALSFFLNNIKTILFNDLAFSNTIYNVRNELVNLILAFMEEKECPIIIKHMIMSVCPSQKIFNSISNTLKKYYYINKICPPEIEKTDVLSQIRSINKKTTDKTILIRRKSLFDDYHKKDSFGKETKHVKNKQFKNLKFKEDLYYYFDNLYFSDEKFQKSPEFIFCSNFYNYFKLTVLHYKNEESINLWQKLNSFTLNDLYQFNKYSNEISSLQKKKKIDDSDFEHYYIMKFFENISKSVNITIDNTEMLIVYTAPPLLKYLSTNSKIRFLNNVNRETRLSKLYSLMEETIYFKLEIEYNWTNLRNNTLLKRSMLVNYNIIGHILFVISLFFNIFLLVSLQESGNSFVGMDILNGVNISGNILSFFDALILIYWSFTKLKLYYLIERQKYIESRKLENKSNDIRIIDKLFILIYHCVFLRAEINTLIWVFIFNLFGSNSTDLTFLFSLGLISAIFLSPYLINIVLSLVLKGKQLLWCTLFTFILLYIYSTIGYYFTPNRFIQIESEKTYDTCSSIIYCILTVTNQGLRNHAGIGKILNNASFFTNQSNYFFGFFYDLSFYVFIQIIMLHIVFGIVLDTFRSLRKIQYKTDHDIAYVCFICDLEKDECEKNSENFQYHCEHIHNVWDYANYMITLRLRDSQDLNAVNSYAKEKLEAKDISWLPFKNNKKTI